MNCKICNSSCKKIFKAEILFKYEIEYFQCTNCDFIQTEKPYWLPEAYQSAITELDIGLVSRNISYKEIVANIINFSFNKNGKFIDYGGGYGLFVRLMRDKGYDYYRQDYFCENMFAKNFDITDLPVASKFELLSSFEVFEHLEDPISEIKKMLQYSDSILFSTELQPIGITLTPETWWYFFPETGQHISFYSLKSLKILAEQLGLNLHTAGSTHLLSRKKINMDDFYAAATNKKSLAERLIKKIFSKQDEPSLLQADFNYLRNKVNKIK